MKPSSITKLLTNAFKHNRRVLIVGSPGIGKTQVAKAAVEKAKLPMIMMHPAVSDPTDFKGMPAVVNGKAEFLAFGQLRKLAESKQKIVCFIDDIGQAPGTVQAALMQFLWGGELEGHKLDNVLFVGCTNDATHMAGVQTLLEPVKSRWSTIVNMEVNLPDWLQWGWNNGMPPELMGYIQFRPDNLDNFKASRAITNSPSPRTVAELGQWINEGLLTEYGEGDALQIAAGCVGEGFANEFFGFCRTYKSLPDIDQALRDPMKAQLPKSGNDASVNFAVSAAVAAKCNQDNFGNGIKYLTRIGEEWAFMAVRDASRRDNTLLNTEDFIQWHKDNKTLLNAV